MKGKKIQGKKLKQLKKYINLYKKKNRCVLHNRKKLEERLTVDINKAIKKLYEMNENKS